MLYKFISIDSPFLLNVRIVFIFSAFVHLLVTAIVTLSIDTTVDPDPNVRAYYYVRWKLLTCWFNLVTLFYLPAALYSNLRLKQGLVTPEVVKLRHVSDALMTGIIFPVTVFADLSFWWMFLTDPTLLGAPKIFEYLPIWAQHSLHTVSLFVVILDLVLTPRRRPKSFKPRIALLLAFIITYSGMIYISNLRGDNVYPISDGMNTANFIFIVLISTAILVSLFHIQWMINDFLWGTTRYEKNE